MKCPSCGSHETQRLQVLYESGVTQVHAFHHVYGVANAPVAFARTDGVEQTLLAQRLAPPLRRSAAPAGALLVAAGVVLYDAFRTAHFGPVERFEAIVGCAALVLGLVLAQVIGRINARIRDDLDRWERSWHCNQCGALFLVT